MKSIEFGLKGQKRFEHTYAWIRYNELNESDKSSHPEHTVDDYGYTYLMVPIGAERIYDDMGELKTLKYHQLIKNGHYEHSSLNGPVTEYFANGKVQAKGSYKDGSLKGKYQTYYADGRVESERYYDNDVPVGEWKGWHANGKQAYWYLYDLNTAHPFEPNKKEWADNGQLTLEQVLDIGANGFLREWSKDGVLIHDVDIHLLDRTRGLETWWFENGQLHWKRDYRYGQDTSFIEFYKNGDLARLEISKEKGLDTYRENRRWYPNLVPESVFIAQTRKDGFFSQSQELYYPNGQLQSTVLYKNKECYKEFYATNGIKIRTLHTISDSLHGPYQLLDSLGNLLLDYRYQSGVRNGWCREYDHTGKLLFSKYYQNGIPVKDSAAIERKTEFLALTQAQRKGLDRLISFQNIDSLQFSKNEIEALFKLAYLNFSEQFEPLPQTDYNGGLREYNQQLRVHLRRKEDLIWMDLSLSSISSVSFIVYPDMEIEIFNHRYTKEELNKEQNTNPKFYMWND
jgi:antitoxin component YwqK of YwqJK toxin-antitoxin module